MKRHSLYGAGQGSTRRAAMGGLTEAVQPARIGINVQLSETDEAHGQQEAVTAELPSQREDADVSTRTAAGGRCRAGRTPGRAPGGRAAVLQRHALRWAAAPAPHESRSRLASGPRHSPDAQAGAAGCPCGPAGAPRLFRECLSQTPTEPAAPAAGPAPCCGPGPR